jgi:xanthine dehydrogenase molybdopterin-binding subunit B
MLTTCTSLATAFVPLPPEHMEHDPVTGAATTTSTWNYKVPGVSDIPARLNVAMLKESPLHLEVRGL